MPVDPEPEQRSGNALVIEVTQSIMAIASVAAVVYLAVTGGAIPQGLDLIVGTVLGFYFGRVRIRPT